MTRLSKRIANRLKRARKAAGLTQQDLASKAGVSMVHISRLERAQADQPRRAELESVAAALGMSADDLMGIDDDEAQETASLDSDAVLNDDEQSAVCRNLEARYGEDAHFVEAVLDRLADEPREQRRTILGLLLGGIGDALGRPRELQLSR